MKKYKAFLALLLIKAYSSFSCAGFYPYGESARFFLFNTSNPSLERPCGLDRFRYTSRFFSDTPVSPACENKPDESEWLNVGIWARYFNNKIEATAIYEALYELSYEDIDNKNCSNTFIRYLQAGHNPEVLRYLRFMHSCTVLNTEMSDPWERSDSARLPEREGLMIQALKNAKQCSDRELQKRYAFLAIRLAFYNDDTKNIHATYKRYFESTGGKNIVDYWALYFFCLTEKESALRNLHAAQVFANAPDKRMNIIDAYKRGIPVDQTLALASDNKDRSAVLLLSAILSPGRALWQLNELSKLEADKETFRFLINREINKLEDWIYTPHYMYFEASTNQSNDATNRMFSLAKTDREYAAQLSLLLRSLDKSNGRQDFAMQAGYLNLMAENYNEALDLLDKALAGAGSTPLRDLLNQLKSLALIERQAEGSAVIVPFCENILMQQAGEGNYRFVLAVAKELEYRNNYVSAALLMSKLNTRGDEENYAFWRNSKDITVDFNGFHDYYFTYLDAMYNVKNMADLTSAVAMRKQALKSTRFQSWLYETCEADLPLLYDLSGTKCMRENNLEGALQCFDQVPDSTWNTWLYTTYLEANPFYTDAYHEHYPTPADTIRFTKPQLVRRLTELLQKCNDEKNKNRDYYYYLVANCYLNMSQYGNSWLMRRYNWTSYVSESRLPDDDEYYGCDLAKTYYLKAMETSGSRRFKALCLRMAGRCEKHRRLYEASKSYYDDIDAVVFKANICYKNLKTNFPEYYKELISNCESINTYFMERRKLVKDV